MPIKKIARATRHNGKLVRNVWRGPSGDVLRDRKSNLDAYLPLLNAEWTDSCRKGTEIWPRLRASGFTGSRRVIGE